MNNRKKQQRLAIGLVTSALVLVIALIGIFAVKMVERSKSQVNRPSAGQSTVSQTESGTATSSKTPADSTKSGSVASSADSTKSGSVASSTEGAQSGSVTPSTESTESGSAASSAANTPAVTSSTSQFDSSAGETPTEAPVASSTSTVPTEDAVIVCIDPGHETNAITDLEPIAPGSTEMKQGVTSGTEGAASGKTEYQVNLEVSLKLRDILTARGYKVVMTREVNDVTLSNVQRAQIATEAKADIFVRIHCNGLDNHDINGVLCYGPTEENPYLAKDVIAGSRRLCQLLRDNQAAITGQKVMDNLFADNMTGINWATMPVAIVEMGFMTNEAEDLYMASEDGQQAIATGLANGIDAYFAVG